MADRSVCPHWLRGHCMLGESCKFAHPDERAGQGGPRRKLRRTAGTQRAAHVPMAAFRHALVSGLQLGKDSYVVVVGGGLGRSACQLAVELQALYGIKTLWLGPAAVAAAAAAGVKHVQAGLDRNIYHRSPLLPGSPTVCQADVTLSVLTHAQVFISSDLIKAASADNLDLTALSSAQLAMFSAATILSCATTQDCAKGAERPESASASEGTLAVQPNQENSVDLRPFLEREEPTHDQVLASVRVAVAALRQCKAIVGLLVEKETARTLADYCAVAGKSFALAPAPADLKMDGCHPPPSCIQLQGAAGGSALLWMAGCASIQTPCLQEASSCDAKCSGLASRDCSWTVLECLRICSLHVHRDSCRYFYTMRSVLLLFITCGASLFVRARTAPLLASKLLNSSSLVTQVCRSALLFGAFGAGWFARSRAESVLDAELLESTLLGTQAECRSSSNNGCGCKRAREWQALQKLRPDLELPAIPTVESRIHENQTCSFDPAGEEIHRRVVDTVVSRDNSKRGQLFRESSFQEAVPASCRRKEEVNGALVDLVLEQRPNLAAALRADPMLLVLLLDTPAWGSLHAFTRRQPSLVACQQMVIPQPDLSQYLEMIRDSHQYPGVRAQRLDHWLCANAQKGFRVACAFFDFECRLHGSVSQRLSPAADVMRYFRFGFPANPSVLCLTVGLWPYGEKARVSTFEEVDLFVRHEAWLNGYTAALRKRWVGRLVTLLYEVQQ